MAEGRTNIRELLGSPPPPPDPDRELKALIEAARIAGATAAERLVLAGRYDDIVILVLGKNGTIHVKDYGRTGVPTPGS